MIFLGDLYESVRKVIMPSSRSLKVDIGFPIYPFSAEYSNVICSVYVRDDYERYL